MRRWSAVIVSALVVSTAACSGPGSPADAHADADGDSDAGVDAAEVGVAPVDAPETLDAQVSDTEDDSSGPDALADAGDPSDGIGQPDSALRDGGGDGDGAGDATATDAPKTEDGAVGPDGAPDADGGGNAKQCELPADCLGSLVPGACQVIACDVATWTCVLNDATDDADCDDGNICTNNDRCDGGVCSGPPLPCSDTTFCTIDTCDPLVGCVHAPLVGPCDDGDACTTPDTCIGGQCVGTVYDCDDLNPCTSDQCDPALGCLHAPSSVACDDGNACTTQDGCVAAECVGATVDCDDGDPCTEDVCDSVVGCEYSPSVADCDDGSACTEDDACTLGVCVGTPISCDDGDPCTASQCDPATGCSSLLVDGAACSDGDFCTVADSCAAGSCTGQQISGCGATFCGDGVCDVSETCASCPLDCGECLCGDGLCTLGEDCEGCPADCGGCTCGDGTCSTGETCLSCLSDCSTCTCGDGLCLFGEDCSVCPLDCGACPCGDGVCMGELDEDCASCPADCGACLPCGDGSCGPDESCEGCTADCGPCVQCGDGVCMPEETCEGCPTDCGACTVCGDATCDPGETCTTCPADCPGCDTCGDGLCQGNESCLSCVADCTPPLPFGSCGAACAPADGPTACAGNSLCVPLLGGLMALPAGAPTSGVCLGQEPPCDPVSQFGCATGETCVVAISPAFVGWASVCLGGAGGQPLGAPCLPLQGVNCKAGLLCHEGLCAAPCDPAIPTCPAGTCVDVGVLFGDGPTGAAGLCLDTCGDGSCAQPEDCVSCPTDCGACSCGDGVCTAGEDCATCEGDCGGCPCGDGLCQGAESCGSCHPDCGPCTCGDGACQPLETCGTCPADCGACAICGDGACEGIESCDVCPADCGSCPLVCDAIVAATCGQACDPTTAAGEDPATCDANQACVPSTSQGGIAFAALYQGSGACGEGCDADDDCPMGSVCVGVSGLTTAGVCRASCEPPLSPPCPFSEACIEQPGGAAFCAPAGPCVPGASHGCPPASGACVEFAAAAGTGFCLVGCQAGTSPCVGGSCHTKTDPLWHQGTCVGQPTPCDPALQTGCDTTETCQVLGGSFFGGVATVCTPADGTAAPGAPCADGCGPGLICWSGTCRTTCAPPTDCAAGPCADVSAEFGQPGQTWGVCPP